MRLSIELVCSNERQQVRFDALKWESKVDCPSRAQINPELNHWPSVTSMGDEIVKSCRIDSTSTKRPKSSVDRKKMEEDEETMRKKFIRREFWCPVGPKGSYSISEQNGIVHIVDYNRVAPKGHEEDCGCVEEEE